jgi:hypothetical protein
MNDILWEIAVACFIVIIVWRVITLIIESVKMNKNQKVNGKK